MFLRKKRDKDHWDTQKGFENQPGCGEYPAMGGIWTNGTRRLRNPERCVQQAVLTGS